MGDKESIGGTKKKSRGEQFNATLSCAAYPLLNSIIMKQKPSEQSGNTNKGLGNSILQGWPGLDFVFCFLEVRKYHSCTEAWAGVPPRGPTPSVLGSQGSPGVREQDP